MYQIGKITNTHGIKGEVKIYNLSDFNRFSVGAKIFVMMKDKRVDFEIERVRFQGNLLIVKLKAYDNINDILVFKGLDVYSDHKPEKELETDDFHYQDLLDKAVYTSDDVLVGYVQSMIPVPQGHLLEVEKLDGKKVLIPFVKAFVGDILEDRIMITPIEGLL
ncbi:MAG: 16S rRNA processing protein RimM [Acholeplasmataceae bacterium]|nr:16S rRNA processing protein RimM [Acholeplasmataceae bacterium]